MADYAPIKDFLVEHARKGAISFHMPGHKGSALYRRFEYDDFIERIMDCDITEIAGADNLFQAEGILKECQDIYANLYDVDRSYLLINGTSGGIIAAILAAVPRGRKLIMARNSHKSVFNAMALADAKPVYAYPEIVPEFGISGAISPGEIEMLLDENPEAEAVILPSPNYYGICSDVEAIAEVVHSHGKVLIVDQAHGAHLKMFSRFGVSGFPKSAEECGADIVINSIHKTMASFTQSAVLNLNSDRVSHYVLEDKLQCIESTSPSYILMASLDINAQLMNRHGETLMREWADNLNVFYDHAHEIEHLDYIGKLPGMDWTKINVSFARLGISGAELEALLMKENIFSELYTGNLLMCMTGVGNTKEHIEALVNALKNISRSGLKPVDLAGIKEEGASAAYRRAEIFDIPKNKVRVPLTEAEGLICAGSLIPYPPGIPLVCPGEKYEKDILEQLKKLREEGAKVIGIDDSGKVLAGKS